MLGKETRAVITLLAKGLPNELHADALDWINDEGLRENLKLSEHLSGSSSRDRPKILKVSAAIQHVLSMEERKDKYAHQLSRANALGCSPQMAINFDSLAYELNQVIQRIEKVEPK